MCLLQLFYTGKSSALGMRSVLGDGQWSEIYPARAMHVSAVATGHEGLHALVLMQDGSVYFMGTAKRGEDAEEGSTCQTLVIDLCIFFNG